MTEAEQSKAIRTCGCTIAGRTVTIQDDWITLLAGGFWNETISCGQHFFLRKNPAIVICWKCAYKQGLVSQTEEERNRIIAAVLSDESK